jgi:hypothetical protein
MFENKKFSIIEYGAELTLKRVKIFEEIILKNGGLIIPYKQSKLLSFNLFQFLFANLIFVIFSN